MATFSSNQAFSPLDPSRTLTGRLVVSQPAIQVFSQRLSHRSLTPRQAEVLRELGDGKITIEAQSGPVTFTKKELLSIFSGQQLPRDAKVREFLGLPSLDVDFSPLERRVMAYSTR